MGERRDGRGREVRRALRRGVPWLGAGLLLVAVLAGAWLLRQRLRDPVPVLDRRPGGVRVLRDSAYAVATGSGEERIYRDLTLLTDRIDTIRVTSSRPAESGGEPLPLLFVLGGLRTGREALAEVPRHGRAVLVAYEYPYSRETWYRRTALTQIPAIRRAVLDVPAQVVVAASRLSEEPHVDPSRTAVLGYSFGALFTPAVQRLASARGRPFRAVAMAYGGADLARLFRANLDVGPSALRDALAWLAATALRPMEPALHLPELEGSFLVVSGARDEQVPAASARELARLTPDPKEVVRLDSGHMGPGRPELTERIVDLTRVWLEREGIIDAGTAAARPGAPDRPDGAGGSAGGGRPEGARSKPAAAPDRGEGG